MSIYTVTYCTMDQDADANPFWHTCILLSCYDASTRKMEVVEKWGFYGLPTTENNALVRSFKIKLGLDVDFDGNHGILRHEDVRRLDIGRGLHGVTFDLSEEKFNALSAKCHKMAEDQKDAIMEYVIEHGIDLIPKGKYRIDPYEKYSREAYLSELEKAEKEGRPPRLQRFALSPANPRTCKMQIIELLKDILTDEQIERLKGYHPAVSRMSGPMETIYIYSTGPVLEHKKRSGEIVHYRDDGLENSFWAFKSDEKNKPKEKVRLFWTFPPQELETENGEVRKLFAIDKEYINDAKTIVSQLQRLEWFFRDVTFITPEYNSFRTQMLATIQELYTAFAEFEPKKFDGKHDDWQSKVLWFFSAPRDEDEKALMEKISNAKNFLNALYFAAVDNVADDSVKNLGNDVELLAACIPEKKKQQLCSILNRTYYDAHEYSAATTPTHN